MSALYRFSVALWIMCFVISERCQQPLLLSAGYRFSSGLRLTSDIRSFVEAGWSTLTSDTKVGGGHWEKPLS